eukprot:316643-Amorphochlora_amoeboformis.AAC.2
MNWDWGLSGRGCWMSIDGRCRVKVGRDDLPRSNSNGLGWGFTIFSNVRTAGGYEIHAGDLG